VIHAATLHKPHIGSHSRQDFVDTNVAGTLTLLVEAVAAGVSAFIYLSTTGGWTWTTWCGHAAWRSSVRPNSALAAT
jgi:nucleoside-diphosphate-sugar epimerase